MAQKGAGQASPGNADLEGEVKLEEEADFSETPAPPGFVLGGSPSSLPKREAAATAAEERKAEAALQAAACLADQEKPILRSQVRKITILKN
jgi:hypothetical protein